jgi:uncharacterized membrane protein
MIYLIVFLSLLIRFISLNQSLWLDEATSALVARMPVSEIFTKFLPGDFHPPLYYLVLKYWTTLFGYSEVSLRTPSVIFGIVTVYVTYLIGKKLISKEAGLIASGLVATSGLAVYYSQEARMYSMAALLVSIAVYLYDSKKWLGFSFALVLIGMTDYVSLLVVPIFLITAQKEVKRVALSLIPLVLTFLLWSPIFVKQISGGLSLAGSAWWKILGLPTLKNALLIPVKFIFGRISFDNKPVYALIATLGGSVFAYLLIKARKAPRTIWYWLIIPIILGILLSFKIPTLSFFRFLFCLPAFYLLAAYGIEKTGKFKRLFLIIIFSANLLTTGYYLLTPRFHREDWRAAATAIGGGKLVLPSDSQKEALIYYGKGDQIVKVYNLEPGETEVWLSRYVWEIVDPMEVTRHKLEGLGYNKATEYNFNGVVFWKYTQNKYARKQSLPPGKERI